MKKRTSLVCFLIFTLCVFYTAIPNTVFGQEASLAEQVIADHGEVLQREDLQDVLIGLLDALRDPEVLQHPQVVALGGVDGLLDFALNAPALVLGNPALGLDPASVERYTEIVETDAKVRALLMDSNFRTVLKDPDPAGVEAVKMLVAPEQPEQPEQPETPEQPEQPEQPETPEQPEQPEQPEASLAAQVIADHGEVLQRGDLQDVLIGLLDALRDPAVLQHPQVVALGGVEGVLDFALNAPALVLGNPALGLDPASVERYTEIVETDAKVRALLMDSNFRTVLQDPDPAGTNAIKMFVDAEQPEQPEQPETPEQPEQPEQPETPEQPEQPEPPTIVDVPDVPTDKQFPPAPPSNLSGKSRLGGLSLNSFNSSQIIEDLITELVSQSQGVTLEPAEAEAAAVVVVDALLDQLKGFLPTRQIRQQIRQVLLRERISAFPKEADHLDTENFGNAITPNFNDFIYSDFGRQPNRKYLTSNGLHLYTRVPAKVDGPEKLARVEFGLSDGTTVPGTPVTSEDSIPYTFRLEETLAATNLPAWPGLNAQLFSDVTLRYSFEGPMPEGGYASAPMTSSDTGNGVVWTTNELGIPRGGGVYYYFEVDLAEPLLFSTLARDAVIDWKTATLDDVFADENLHKIEINSWKMPDPRNLQLQDRGIVKALFTRGLNDEIRSVLALPEVETIGLKLLTGQPVNPNEILGAVPREQLRRIWGILEDNTTALIADFEHDFDPLLTSVFTVPRVDLETHSLWVAHIPDIGDGNYQLKADVLDAEGTVLDRIQENITVDTSAPGDPDAPGGGINIGLGENVTGYEDGDVFIATAPTAGTAAMLNFSSTATDVAPGVGYLFYQLIGLNPNGTPVEESSLQSPNTWMPLTVKSGILASRLWNKLIEDATDKEIASVLKGLVNAGVSLPAGLDDAAIVSLLRTQTFETLLSIVLTVENIQGPIDAFLKGLAPFVGFSSLKDSQYQLIVDALGATVDIIDQLVPVTFNPSDHVVMPIQGEGETMPLIVGDYGIRALGIDTLFNVGAYAKPARLRIVAPVYDKATVTAAAIAEKYRVGADVYEMGTIYANTTDGVMLTGTIELTGHPVTVLVQYMDASGNWAKIGDATVNETDGTFVVSWDVSDFDALLAAGDTVTVQAVATNALQLTEDEDPMEFSIKLDDGFYPPEVLALVVDETSIEMRNPDSEGPQGTVIVNAYTRKMTGPDIGEVQLKVGGEVFTANEGVPLQGIPDVLQAAIGAAAGGTDASLNPEDYLKWLVTVDTTKLDDTITEESGDAARDYTKDENRHVIHGFAISMDATGGSMEWPIDPMEAKSTMLSVDNVDDVGPLGPTEITVVADADGMMVEADTQGVYTLRGLVDPHDPSVPSRIATLTIENKVAKRKTYDSVMLVSDPPINAGLISEITETPDGSGVFTVTIDVSALGIDGNGTYKLHALVDDKFNNGQDGESPESKVQVKNYLRPDPAVFKLMVDVGTEKNVDSGGPQGTFTFTGYTIEQNSPPIESILLKAKRAKDPDTPDNWKTIGTGDASTSVDIEDAALPGVLDHLTGIVVDGTEAGDKSVVAIDETNKQWVVSVNTRDPELKLLDTITKDSPADGRDASKDDNQYTVRAFAVDASGKEWASDATAMFSLDNVDDVAPLAPTSVSVVDVEPAEDGSYTVGGLVDKYDDAVPSPMATFRIEPEAKRETYESVKFMTDIEGALVGEITETEEGVSGVFMVTVDVGTLADGETYLAEGTYTFQALAYDGSPDGPDEMYGNLEADTDESKAIVTVDNDYRPAPEVLVIAVDPESITQRNPDSGAPQGTIVLNARSHEITSPPTSGMLFEVKRPGDEAWVDVGTAPTDTNSMSVSDVSDAELADVVGDIANTAVSGIETSGGGEATAVPIDLGQTYQEWALEVDTTMIMPDAEDKGDTITADSPAADAASRGDNQYMVEDTNQYMVRVTAIAEVAKEPDKKETPSPDGITAHFSVDNVDDVSPKGPTNIIAVADVAGMIDKNEDDSYTISNIVDDTLPSPIATFTIEQAADPRTYEGGSVNLVQTTADGTETTTEGEAGVLDTITIDVGMLENGTYMFHALTVDEFGNVQADDSETDGSRITVHVLNFRVSDVTDITVIAVDGTDVAEPPAEPIPLRNSVTVNFMVANGSLVVEELDEQVGDVLRGSVNGDMVPSESAEDPENTFSLMVEVGALVDGVYSPDAMVTKRNGSVTFPVTTVNVDNTGPMVTIESPTEDEAVDSLPTVRATYHDGAGAGVDGATGSLVLVRLRPNEVEVADLDSNNSALEKDAESLVYTRREPLAGGAYRVTVQVTDDLGNVGEGSAEFAVNGTTPTVTIHSLTPGQTFDHGKPLISGGFSGVGTKVTKLTIMDDDDATPDIEVALDGSGNQFSYTPEVALANGNYTVVVEATDADNNMVQTSVVFTVDIPEPPKDTTPPVISSVAPSGLIKIGTSGAVVTLSAVVSDEQSDIISVKFRVADVNGSINGVPFRSVPRPRIKSGEMETVYSLEPGSYNAEVIAESLGGATKHSWSFSLDFDNIVPTISSVTPNGTIRTELPTVSVSATDESGIKRIRISVFDSQGQQVKGSTENDGKDKAGGITRADFIPDNPLSEGTYLIVADADDTLDNTATVRGSFTIDFDTAAPIITMAAPHQNARFVLKPGDEAPTVSISYADAESGIDVDSITMVIEGAAQQYRATASGTKITLSSEQKSASQVVYPLTVDTKAASKDWVGKYVVRFEVSDKAHLDGNIADKRQDKKKSAREANWTVHTFSFFLEAAEGPIMTTQPLNSPNPFKDSTTIRYTLARQSKVNIVIYDMTLRPVRVLVDGVAEQPGKKAIEWDGTSSAGVDLARGIYFCQIIVTDEIEPEYAILKLALTR